jgi:hypothetical protein
MLTWVRLEIVLILMQGGCMVFSKRTISSEIIFDAPDETPRGRRSRGILFWSVWRQCYCHCNIVARFAPKVP